MAAGIASQDTTVVVQCVGDRLILSCPRSSAGRVSFPILGSDTWRTLPSPRKPVGSSSYDWLSQWRCHHLLALFLSVMCSVILSGSWFTLAFLFLVMDTCRMARQISSVKLSTSVSRSSELGMTGLHPALSSTIRMNVGQS